MANAASNCWRTLASREFSVMSSSSMVATGKAAVARLSVEEEERAAKKLLSDSFVGMAEMQMGLPAEESRCFELRMRTGESEVDGRATQSIMLVRNVDMVRREGDGGAGAGGWGVDVDAVSLSFCDMSCVFIVNAEHVRM